MQEIATPLIVELPVDGLSLLCALRETRVGIAVSQGIGKTNVQSG